MKFCPKCATLLEKREIDGRQRAACPAEGCDYVFWNNPVPVVAGIVEHEDHVLLVRQKGWPEKMFGLVTGFLEKGETPEEGILREVQEELDLRGNIVSLVGVYAYKEANQVILVYHVTSEGKINLSRELENYKAVPPEKLKPWPFGTGLAIREWLERRRS